MSGGGPGSAASFHINWHALGVLVVLQHNQALCVPGKVQPLPLGQIQLGGDQSPSFPSIDMLSPLSATTVITTVTSKNTVNKVPEIRTLLDLDTRYTLHKNLILKRI